MEVPGIVMTLARRVADAGGRAYVVGGWVRDHHLGLESKDADVEVHGLPEEDLERLLRRLGRVNAVGRSFGVYKLRHKGLELDVSLPRRDSKVGPGHKGIAVEGDPFMGIEEASRRRDLTLNAMLHDPLTGETLDPHGGLRDLTAGVLREVDPQTFQEDPLRALRAVQFAARFGFRLAPSLEALCRDAQLDELPAERIRGELEKLLLKAAQPGSGVLLLRSLGLADKVVPELAPTLDADMAAAVDRGAVQRDTFADAPPRLALMLGVLLHRLPPGDAELTLDRLDVHTWQRWPVRKHTLLALETLRATERWDDTTLRALADTVTLRFVLRLRHALTPAAGALQDLARAEALGVADAPLPRVLTGGDLFGMGVEPGPQMGALLAEVRKAQHAGGVTDQAAAMALVRRHLRSDAESS
ncbi:MAG: CCA tRNA nucleotidyltransferase [Alphaproteobacteria bacterium]|nr:CCA tRNA nucleotidyltransferase [Alphaproteobacteria bacterium]